MNKTFEDLITFLEAKATELKASQVKQRIVNVYRLNVLPASMILAILWGMGIVVAKGFWATLCALIIPFVGPGLSVVWMIEKFAGGQ